MASTRSLPASPGPIESKGFSSKNGSNAIPDLNLRSVKQENSVSNVENKRLSLKSSMSTRVTNRERKSFVTSVLHFFMGSKEKENSFEKEKDLARSHETILTLSRTDTVPRTSRRMSGSSYDFQNSSKSSAVSGGTIGSSRLHSPRYYIRQEGDDDPDACDDDRNRASLNSLNSDGSTDDDEFRDVHVSEISWSNVRLPGLPISEIVIGKGSFGTVIRAIWICDGKEREVAIKVQTRANSTSREDKRALKKVRRRAYKEARMMILVRNKVNSNVITDAYGIIDGPLPDAVASLLRKNIGESSLGIVMKYEGGGSLDKMISLSARQPTQDQSKVYTMQEKVRLLTQVAKGLVDLHAVGIIHADIKAANVLLSSDNPPEVRLADFGMSIFRQDIINRSVDIFSPVGLKSLKNSRPEATTKNRGTRVFCAPEMLVNPYQRDLINSTCESETAHILSTVAKPSRRTDMYAFGLLSWQVLAQQRPFSDISSEAMLCAKVHQGHRPPLDKLPFDTPISIVKMIVACWSGDREVRPSAGECYQILCVELPRSSTKTSDKSAGPLFNSLENHVARSRESFDKLIAGLESPSLSLSLTTANSSQPQRQSVKQAAKSRLVQDAQDLSTQGHSLGRRNSNGRSSQSLDYPAIYNVSDSNDFADFSPVNTIGSDGGLNLIVKRKSFLRTTPGGSRKAVDPSAVQISQDSHSLTSSPRTSKEDGERHSRARKSLQRRGPAVPTITQSLSNSMSITPASSHSNSHSHGHSSRSKGHGHDDKGKYEELLRSGLAARLD